MEKSGTEERDPEVVRRIIEEGSRGHVVVKCGFCKGRGTDPFDLLWKGSRCQVCSGKGRYEMREPLRMCRYCKGSGVHPSSRNTCDVCNGKGLITMPEKSMPCTACHGDAEDHATSMPCTQCHGWGVIPI
jgi:DnaJ-class molecular chaperone